MSALHMAVDAHRLVCEPLTSGATYLGALVTEWLAYPEPPEVSLLLPWRPAPGTSEWRFLDSPRVQLLAPDRAVNPHGRYAAQFAWQQRTIPALLRRHPPDVYFSPFHLTPQRPFGLPVVTAIHDLCGLQEPFSRWFLLPRFELWSACLRAQRLICVSEYTYSMLSRWSPRSARKATVVHNGIKGATLPAETASACVRQLCPDLVPQEYLLWIGHPSARKNPELLFDVFGAHHQRFPGHKYALVAPEGAHGTLRAMAQARGIEASLRLFSRVDNRTRDALYRCALALVFPSRCEGFGFPVLEAMFQGCPTFASEQGPAREMVAGAVPMAKELTLDAFMSALREYQTRSAAERSRISAELIGRAAGFSSQLAAARTLAVLRGVAK